MIKETIPAEKLFREGRIILPHGVAVDGKVVRDIEIRATTGNEEDILADGTRATGGKGDLLVSGSDRITKILSRCTISFGEETHEENRKSSTSKEKFFDNLWKRATAGDRQFACVCLRRFSVGNKYVFNEVCPECKHEIKKLTVDLSELEVYPPFRDVQSDDPLQVAKIRETMSLEREHDGILPSGTKFSYKLLTGADEDEYAKSIDRNPQAWMSYSLLGRLTALDGAHPTLSAIKDLSSPDRAFLLEFLDNQESGVDSEQSITCDNPKCGHSFTKQISFASRSFFFPSGS
jgi:hypothetical protein